MASTGVPVFSAGVPPTDTPYSMWSGEVDYITLSWYNRLSGENISASGVSAFMNWYIPAGFTAFASGTASGGSAMWMKISATAAPSVSTVYRFSARITTTSAKSLFEYFDVRVWTGA